MAKTKEKCSKEEVERITNIDFDEFYKVTQTINESLDLKKTLKAVAESVSKISQAKFCYIFLNENDDEMKCVFKLGNRAIARENYKISDSYYTKKVIQSKKPIQITDFSKYPYDVEQYKEFFKKEKICCALYLPIIRKHKVIGYMWVLRGGDICDLKVDIKRIMLFVNQMAIAIDNSRLHERLTIDKTRWRYIFEDTSNGMIVTNEELDILFVNKAFEQIIDKKEKTIKEKNMRDLFASENDKIFLDREFVQNEQKRRIRKEVLLETKNSIVWASMRGSKSFNSKGTIRFIFSFEDITSKKELESEKNEFVSVMSHELRSPLTAMKGYLNLLEKKEVGILNQKQHAFLKRIESSTERMTALVENLLDVNRINTGKIQLNLVPVSIGKVFKKVKGDLKTQLEQKNMKVSIEKDEQVYVLGDKDRLYQILYNLLDNAIKYSFPKGKIEAGFHLEKESAMFYIKDNGVGISPLEQKKLFSKFSRVDNIFSVASGGTGLGLYIVKNLVLAHNGLIWIESKEGKGATFKIKLPLAKQLSLVNH